MLTTGFEAIRGMPAAGAMSQFAMPFVLQLAMWRDHLRAPDLLSSKAFDAVRSPLTALWELAERFHPEHTWLAQSWLCGDRTLDEIAQIAPREPLAHRIVDALRCGAFADADLPIEA